MNLLLTSVVLIWIFLRMGYNDYASTLSLTAGLWSFSRLRRSGLLPPSFKYIRSFWLLPWRWRAARSKETPFIAYQFARCHNTGERHFTLCPYWCFRLRILLLYSAWVRYNDLISGWVSYQGRLVFGHYLPEQHYEFRAKADCGVSSEGTNFVFAITQSLGAGVAQLIYKRRWTASEKLFDSLRVYRLYCFMKHPNGLWCSPCLLSVTYRVFCPWA